MNYLFPEPHQADERAQCAGDHEAALQAICEKVLSTGGQTTTQTWKSKNREIAMKKAAMGD